MKNTTITCTQRQINLTLGGSIDYRVQTDGATTLEWLQKGKSFIAGFNCRTFGISKFFHGFGSSWVCSMILQCLHWSCWAHNSAALILCQLDHTYLYRRMSVFNRWLLQLQRAETTSV